MSGIWTALSFFAEYGILLVVGAVGCYWLIHKARALINDTQSKHLHRKNQLSDTEKREHLRQIRKRQFAAIQAQLRVHQQKDKLIAVKTEETQRQEAAVESERLQGMDKAIQQSQGNANKSQSPQQQPETSHNKRVFTGVHEVANLLEFVELIKTPSLTVVDFFATWCSPCDQLAPKLLEMSRQHVHLQFLKVDVDRVSECFRQHRITAMPTLVFFRNRKEVARMQGTNMTLLLDLVKRHG